MSIALPSKKIKALIIIVAGIFFAYFISTWNIASWFRSESTTTLSLEAQTLGTIESDLDTDRDGLKDWQELLWGTNKDDADTDKDGTRDGQEIESGRDPGVAGPDDMLSKTRGISEASVASFSAGVSADPDNISQSVSRDLFAKFMSLQSSGNLNDETQEEIVSSVINEIDPGSIPPRYSLGDVSITETSKASLRVYGNEVAKAVFSLSQKVTGNSSNDQALASYDGVIQTLKGIKVPSSLGLTHLQVLNNFNASYQMLVLLEAYEADPVKGLVALKSLQTNALNGVELFKAIALEMQNNDIIFDKTEAGYIWNNYL